MFTATKDDTVQTLKNSTQNFKENARETYDEAKSDLRDTANKAGRKVRHFINSATDEISHATDTVTTQIRTKPVQSSVVALGVGVVLGMLLRR